MFKNIRKGCSTKDSLFLFICKIMTNRRQQRITTVANNRQFDLGIVTENVLDPHNIMACCRTCDAVGVQDIHVINTEMKSRRTWGLKSSSNTKKWLNIYKYNTAEEGIKALRKKYDKIYTTHLNPKAISLYDVDFTQNMAIVFGNEKHGISDEMLALADQNFAIPQVGMSGSLNISVACAVTLYEAYRQRSKAGKYFKNKTESNKILLKEWLDREALRQKS